MEFSEYKAKVIYATSEAEGMLYDFYKFVCSKTAPLKVCALGNCADSIIRIPNMSKETRAIQDECGPYKVTGKPVPIRTFDKTVFYRNRYITDIILQSNIIEIPEYAFRGCRHLKRITIPKSICEIPRCAFDDCISLKDIYFAGSSARWNKVKIDMREADKKDTYFWNNYDCIQDDIEANQAVMKANIHFENVVRQHIYI